jgi:hypothetical protein
MLPGRLGLVKHIVDNHQLPIMIGGIKGRLDEKPGATGKPAQI